MAGQAFQKTDVSRWDVVLTVQLSTHAFVSIKPVSHWEVLTVEILQNGHRGREDSVYCGRFWGAGE